MENSSEIPAHGIYRSVNLWNYTKVKLFSHALICITHTCNAVY